MHVNFVNHLHATPCMFCWARNHLTILTFQGQYPKNSNASLVVFLVTCTQSIKFFVQHWQILLGAIRSPTVRNTPISIVVKRQKN